MSQNLDIKSIMMKCSKGAKAKGAGVMTVVCGLIKGRHHLPDEVSEFVFSADVPQSHICDSNYMDQICVEFIERVRPSHIKVYVTGFTPALLALIKACIQRGIHLSAYNYDREGRAFWEQEVV